MIEMRTPLHALDAQVRLIDWVEVAGERCLALDMSNG